MTVRDGMTAHPKQAKLRAQAQIRAWHRAGTAARLLHKQDTTHDHGTHAPFSASLNGRAV